MTHSPAARGPLITQLQHFRHEIASARADLQEQHHRLSHFQSGSLISLETMAHAQLGVSEASRVLRLALASKAPGAWVMGDLDQILACVDDALVELVRPGA